jgi:hypothetical protein
MVVCCNRSRADRGVRPARETAAELRSRGVQPMQPPFEVYVLGFTDYVKGPARARG